MKKSKLPLPKAALIQLVIFTITCFLIFSFSDSEKRKFIDFQEVNQRFKIKTAVDITDIHRSLDRKSDSIYYDYLNEYFLSNSDTILARNISKNLLDSIGNVFSENSNLYNYFMSLISDNIKAGNCENYPDTLCSEIKHFKDWLVNDMVAPQFYLRSVLSIKEKKLLSKQEFEYMIIYGFIMNRIYWKRLK